MLQDTTALQLPHHHKCIPYHETLGHWAVVLVYSTAFELCPEAACSPATPPLGPIGKDGGPSLQMDANVVRKHTPPTSPTVSRSEREQVVVVPGADPKWRHSKMQISLTAATSAHNKSEKREAIDHAGFLHHFPRCPQWAHAIISPPSPLRCPPRTPGFGSAPRRIRGRRRTPASERSDGSQL